MGFKLPVNSKRMKSLEITPHRLAVVLSEQLAVCKLAYKQTRRNMKPF